jgi:flagellar basal-body rod protein FlgC
MSIFQSIGIAATGTTVYRKWLDAVSDNLSNMNDAVSTSQGAYRERHVVAQQASDGVGAQVGGIVLGNSTGRVVYEPSNPLADKDGNVRYPDIDLASQMGQLMMAQRGYQANLSVVDRAKDAYQAALQIGKSA